ncbi:MAG: metal-dependent transcriptional regulator [Elusimicrobia bacterium CG08_land_8_20_14_0_20_59_10]|nr:MAG: metal-dependent transcriptional regulator [Elusimicrobia bacterium CG08_land_8_20_14_0_20_59_10]
MELSDSLQDYIETVYLLSRRTGYARSRDISRALNVSRPSVNAALKNLAALKLVAHEHYGDIRLTPSGKTVGARVAELHFFLKDFFVSVLGLDGDEAGNDACRIEHAIGRKALRNLKLLAEYLRTARGGALKAEVLAFIRKKNSRKERA